MLLNKLFGSKNRVTKDTVIEEIIDKFEGGYANHKKDKGKETYSGIARKIWKNWVGWVIVDEIKELYPLYLKNKKGWWQLSKELKKDKELSGLVKEFYIENFWDKNKLDNISSIKIQHELFDTGVNCGTGTAAKMLQEALNALNRDEDLKLYKDLKIDGKLGNKTFHAVDLILVNDEVCLLKTLNGEQYIKYKKIIKKDPGQEIFWRSWLRRVDF